MKVIESKLCDLVKASQVVNLETDGLVRDRLNVKYTLLGYVVVEGDRGNRLTLVCVADADGDVFNLVTKSENLKERLSDLIDIMIDDDTFGKQLVKFKQIKTRSGNDCLTVSTTAMLPGIVKEPSGFEKLNEDEEPFA